MINVLGTLAYYMEMTMLIVVTSATIGEAVIGLSPDLRSIYQLIPAVGFIFFFFSGLIIKADTLPGWTQSWIPSVSPIRWAMQGMFINRFKDSKVCPPFIYEQLLESLGWEGEDKEYCINVVFIMFGLYRVLTYIALKSSVMSQSGRRSLLKSTEDNIQRVL